MVDEGFASFCLPGLSFSMSLFPGMNHGLLTRSTTVLFRSKLQNSKRFINRLHGVLNVVEKNRITQMDCKSRDESNGPNYDVIRH